MLLLLNLIRNQRLNILLDSVVMHDAGTAKWGCLSGGPFACWVYALSAVSLLLPCGLLGTERTYWWKNLFVLENQLDSKYYHFLHMQIS